MHRLSTQVEHAAAWREPVSIWDSADCGGRCTRARRACVRPRGDTRGGGGGAGGGGGGGAQLAAREVPATRKGVLHTDHYAHSKLRQRPCSSSSAKLAFSVGETRCRPTRRSRPRSRPRRPRSRRRQVARWADRASRWSTGSKQCHGRPLLWARLQPLRAPLCGRPPLRARLQQPQSPWPNWLQRPSQGPICGA